MKYMTFNNSCFFAALANLLEDFNVNISDRELLLQGNINLVFRYNEEEDYYYSGYQVQQEKWVNNCLKNYEVHFVQKKFRDNDLIQNKINLIKFLKSCNRECVVALKILNSNDRWHATIFQGVEDNKFRFLNMKRANSNEPNIYRLDENELVNKLADVVQCGWLERITIPYELNLNEEKSQSIIILKKYQKDVENFCSKISTDEERLKKRESLFRALLISYHSVIEVIENETMLAEMNIIREQYIKTFNLKGDIILKEHINLDLFNSIIDKIISSIDYGSI